jgi:hypothetical protein
VAFVQHMGQFKGKHVICRASSFLGTRGGSRVLTDPDDFSRCLVNGR